VISAGRNLAKPVLRKSLAVSADELILLQDAQFENPGSYATAHILAAAIREIGDYDLILCGRQAADTDAGQVGSGIAQILNLPCVTAACELKLTDGGALVGRVVSDGIEEVNTPLPAVITVSSEIGEMRYPGVKELMAAQKKPITAKNAQDLGVDISQLKGVSLVSLASPPGRTSQCQYAEAETPEEAGALLAEKVREAQLL
jgi:electron transfer flavoprotein beta subunit